MTDPNAWGVLASYEDYRKENVQVSYESVQRVMAALEASGDPPVAGVQVVTDLADVDLTSVEGIAAEDGGVEDVLGSLPPDLPTGYHRLIHRDGSETPLIVCPSACWLPPGLKAWGWGVQLYAARSARSWGIGDLGDLRRIGRWARSHGASLLMLNPLHAAGARPPMQSSPYYPSSRCFRNPIYLEMDDPAPAGLDAVPIARDPIWMAKLERLEQRWRSEGEPAGLRDYLSSRGEALTRFATFMSIAEQHGNDRLTWPEDLRTATSAGVGGWQDEHRDRIAFHSWLQYLSDEQLEAAAGEIGHIHDLAIGVDVGGADAWIWSDVFAQGVTIGAPPDEFNAHGQNWGMPPWDPWKLRSAGYQPFIETVRAGFRHATGLRVDHVMGLFRLWWIPDGDDPTQGAYVRYPHGDLLGILALESQRAGALVIGEDLGTVEDIVRREMEARDLLSYKVALFEDDPPPRYPPRSMAAISNHDLPTIAGLWDGSDLQEQKDLGLDPDEGAVAGLRRRLSDLVPEPETSDAGEVIAASYSALARAGSAVVVATLDDACAGEVRPNQPGTTDEQRPNWSLPLPLTLEELLAAPLPERIAAALREGRG